MSWYSFRPYVSVAKRQSDALKEAKKLAKKGQTLSPVKIVGLKIATTFWGKAWCDNLEAYSDFASRLPRGRNYVRNGSLLDLQITPGTVTALVSGSELYQVKVTIDPLPASRWGGIRRSCTGKIASVIELLKGNLSDHVMRIVTNQSDGLFPAPAEIEMSCSCPDWAGMCKHVAATMYGVGSRLDAQPDLLFALRKVDHLDLVAHAAQIRTLPSGAGGKTIDAADLGDVFGIELDPLPTGKKPAAPATGGKPARHPHKASPGSLGFPGKAAAAATKKGKPEARGTAKVRPPKQSRAKAVVPKVKPSAARRAKGQRP